MEKTTLNSAKSILDWFLSKSKENKVNILLIVISVGIWYYQNQFKQNLLSKVDDLTDQVIDCKNNEQRIADLEKQNILLKTEAIVFKTAASDIPNPFWIKNLDNEFKYINEAFRIKYFPGLREHEYIGVPIPELFGEHYQPIWEIHDSIVIASRIPQTFKEPTLDNGYSYDIKFPIIIADEVFGVGGLEYIKLNTDLKFE